MLYPVGAMAYKTIENRSDFTVYRKIGPSPCVSKSMLFTAANDFQSISPVYRPVGFKN
jgi:hypothetical protein